MVPALITKSLFMDGISSKARSGWESDFYLFFIFFGFYLSSLATHQDAREWRDNSRDSARQQQKEVLELADNKAILVALFVIPSAIGVHLHALLFPFA